MPNVKHICNLCTMDEFGWNYSSNTREDELQKLLHRNAKKLNAMDLLSCFGFG